METRVITGQNVIFTTLDDNAGSQVIKNNIYIRSCFELGSLCTLYEIYMTRLVGD